jgi:Tat protein translocase TatB subunit
MFNIGPAELIVILLVALLVVGPKRLPEVGRSIGKALREIRRSTDEVRYSFEADLEDEDRPPVSHPGAAQGSTEAVPEPPGTSSHDDPATSGTGDEPGDTATAPGPDRDATG